MFRNCLGVGICLQVSDFDSLVLAVLRLKHHDEQLSRAMPANVVFLPVADPMALPSDEKMLRSAHNEVTCLSSARNCYAAAKWEKLCLSCSQ